MIPPSMAYLINLWKYQGFAWRFSHLTCKLNRRFKNFFLNSPIWSLHGIRSWCEFKRDRNFVGMTQIRKRCHEQSHLAFHRKQWSIIGVKLPRRFLEWLKVPSLQAEVSLLHRRHKAKYFFVDTKLMNMKCAIEMCIMTELAFGSFVDVAK